MPIWKHVYHMLHSLDQWFLNPRQYADPPFHVENLNNIDIACDEYLSRADLNRYFDDIKCKIMKNLEATVDADLLDHPPGCEWQRFTLMLAQHRHLHTHMGMLMGFIIADTGRWPFVVGLTRDIPEGKYEKFYPDV